MVSIGTFLTWQLGFDPRGGITTIDWLVTPQQSLLSVTAGAVYHDGLGWRVLVARLARDVMRPCLLLERRYAPYPKWLGAAFGRLEAARTVGPLLAAALAAPDWPAAQQPLVAASQQAAIRHNRLGLTMALDPSPRPFHDRARLPARHLPPDRPHLRRCQPRHPSRRASLDKHTQP